MTTILNINKTDKANESVQWIENGIANNYINFYDFNEFKIERSIGDGGFGKVYRANWEGPNTLVALKSLKIYDGCMKHIANEVTIMQKISFHPNIINWLGITKKEDKEDTYSDYWFVLEYADGGTLSKYLENNFNKLNWNDKLQFGIQIAGAVSFIHYKDIVHRDLHSDNILVHQNMIKLADFGLSREAEVSNSAKEVFGKLPYTDPHRYKEADSNRKDRPNKKSDVYSIGVLLWEISSGRKPFKYDSRPYLLYDIIDGKRETPIEGTPLNYIKIYTNCWQYEPDDRPDMQQVLSELKSINPNKKVQETLEIFDDNQPNNLSINCPSTSPSLSNSKNSLLQIDECSAITITDTQVETQPAEQDLNSYQKVSEVSKASVNLYDNQSTNDQKEKICLNKQNSQDESERRSEETKQEKLTNTDTDEILLKGLLKGFKEYMSIVDE